MDGSVIILIIILIACIAILIAATVYIDRARQDVNGVPNPDSFLNAAYSNLKTAQTIAIIADIILLLGILGLGGLMFFMGSIPPFLVWILLIASIITLIVLAVYTVIAMIDLNKSATPGLSQSHRNTEIALALIITTIGIVLIGGITFLVISSKKKQAIKQLNQEKFVAKAKLRATQLLPALQASRYSNEIPRSADKPSLPSITRSTIAPSVPLVSSVPLGLDLGYLGPPKLSNL